MTVENPPWVPSSEKSVAQDLASVLNLPPRRGVLYNPSGGCSRGDGTIGGVKVGSLPLINTSPRPHQSSRSPR